MEMQVAVMWELNPLSTRPSSLLPIAVTVQQVSGQQSIHHVDAHAQASDVTS